MSWIDNDVSEILGSELSSRGRESDSVGEITSRHLSSINIAISQKSQYP